MNLDQVKNSRKTVGTKQTMKAVQKGIAVKVFIADDAESHVVGSLMELCAQMNVPVERVESMAELGRACGVDVGTASVAVLK